MLRARNRILVSLGIPMHVFRNRDSIKGGGVGAYIRDDIPFKRRSDLEHGFGVKTNGGANWFFLQ